MRFALFADQGRVTGRTLGWVHNRLNSRPPFGQVNAGDLRNDFAPLLHKNGVAQHEGAARGFLENAQCREGAQRVEARLVQPEIRCAARTVGPKPRRAHHVSGIVKDDDVHHPFEHLE